MITPEEINSVWGSANFGPMPREDVIKYGLLKVASGYSQGYTSRSILKELGLVTDKLGILTRRGKFCLYEYFGKNNNF